MKYFIFLWACWLACGASAAEYTLDKTQSHLRFSGTHAEKAFTGEFKVWDAAIRFDPQNLASSHLEVSIDLASANTGNAMFDGTLPTEDWLDIEHAPDARFISDSITAESEGYLVQGHLRLRDKNLPLRFHFALPDPTAKIAKTEFSLPIDRLTYGIGLASDPKAEWVSKYITLSVQLVAIQQ